MSGKIVGDGSISSSVCVGDIFSRYLTNLAVRDSLLKRLCTTDDSLFSSSQRLNAINVQIVKKRIISIMLYAKRHLVIKTSGLTFETSTVENSPTKRRIKIIRNLRYLASSSIRKKLLLNTEYENMCNSMKSRKTRTCSRPPTYATRWSKQTSLPYGNEGSYRVTILQFFYTVTSIR